MSLRKITDRDLAGKGVMGQADVPGLTAAEMQAKVEEIVRDVVIPNINENIDNFESDFATKEELEQVVLTAGSVTSVFGRAGSVEPRAGDYTYDQVGAAAEQHTANHFLGGVDPIVPAYIGAAAESHAHGNLTADGKIGSSYGLVVMTGPNGVLEAKSKVSSGLKPAPTVINSSGALDFTVQDNADYSLTGVTDLTIHGAPVSCHGFITFGVRGVIDVSGFTVSGGDVVAEAASGEVWEFSVAPHNGGSFIIWKNWSGA